jgi:hypothetical protein
VCVCVTVLSGATITTSERDSRYRNQLQGSFSTTVGYVTVNAKFGAEPQMRSRFFRFLSNIETSTIEGNVSVAQGVWCGAVLSTTTLYLDKYSICLPES